MSLMPNIAPLGAFLRQEAVVQGVEQRAHSTGGFTLVETVIAVSLVLVLATSLYAAGLMVLRMTHFNRVSIEARALGVQQIEELTAMTIPEIAMLVPFPVMTNALHNGEIVERTVDVTGHESDLSPSLDLLSSAYLEVHVNVGYESPLTKSRVTNTFSAVML